MTFLPAETDSGIRFRRVDLPGRPEVAADIENVFQTRRSTALKSNGAEVHTTEHILSAFAGLGVDNVVVEIEAPEPPIADGSARVYEQMIRQAGIHSQNAPRRAISLKHPIYFHENETTISVFPSDDFRVSCTSADANGRFTQFGEFLVTPESWTQDICHARTFCYFDELEYLFNAGLIQGGSLENAVVIRDDAILTKEPLRYANEFVRHKVLDIIGDLALAAPRITGHVVAICPSHHANCEVAKLIRKQCGENSGPNSPKGA